MASQPYLRSRALSDRAVQAKALLVRYPDISDGELDTLIRTFARLPLLDFGLMAADDRLGDKLDLFYADHGQKLRPPLSGVIWAVAVPALIAAVALLYVIVT